MYTFVESDCSIAVYGAVSIESVKEVLMAYKARFGDSAASKVVLVPIDEYDLIEEGAKIITSINYDVYADLRLDALALLTVADLRALIIEPKVRYTRCVKEASEWLQGTKDVLAYDCETTSLYSDGEKRQMLADITDLEYEDITNAMVKDVGKRSFKDLSAVQPTLSKIASSGLVAQKSQYTMFSFADSEDNAFVIDANIETIPMVLEFLVNTPKKIVMHNALFDEKKVHWHTKKFIKNIDDTLLIWKIIENNAQTSQKGQYSLKTLAGSIYKDWAVATDMFSIEYKYNEDLIHYSGIDAMATMYLYNEAMRHPDFQWKEGEGLVGLEDLLPIHHPRDIEHRQSRRFFYENATKPLINSIIKIMNNGIQLNMEKVYKLDGELDEILGKARGILADNAHIKKFDKFKASQKRSVPLVVQELNLRSTKHKSYLVNYLIYVLGWSLVDNSKKFPNGVAKWNKKEFEKLLDENAISIETFEISLVYRYGFEAMTVLARDELALTVSKLSKFNPASNPDVQLLFSMFDIEPLAYTDTEAPSWGRKVLEELLYTHTEGEAFTEMVEQLIVVSQGAIVKQNFVKGFIHYPIDGILYGNINLLGTKTARPTSGGEGSVNFLNMPSTGSPYAGIVKECLVARDGYDVMAADYAGLEDRVLANITKDEGKLNLLHIYEDGSMFDGHCYNATGYFRKEVEQELGKSDRSIEFNKRFKEGCDTNKLLKAIRQKGKIPTFKLAYGGYPDVHKGGAITQEIFDAYHNELYSGVKDYIDNYVLKQAREGGEVYGLLGLRIKSSAPKRDVRSIHNFTIQSFSLLMLIAIAILDKRIEAKGYEGKVIITNTVYDSIYKDVVRSREVQDWVHDNVEEIMTKEYLLGATVPNATDIEIGDNLKELKHYIKE